MAESKAGNLSISNRDLDAMTQAAIDEVNGIRGGGFHVDRVVDSAVGRAALGRQGIGGFKSTVEGVINTKGAYSGISKAGGWESYARSHPNKVTKEEYEATRDRIADRLAEIAANGRVTNSIDFANIGTVRSGKAGSSAKTKAGVETLAQRSWTGSVPLDDPSNLSHAYGTRQGTANTLGRSGITGPGLNVTLSFTGQLAPTLNNMVEAARRQDTPREALSQPFSGRQVDADYQDYTDVLANEQIGIPDLPGPLQGMPAPERSLQGLGDFSMGAAYDNLAPNPVDYSGITKGITHGGTPYGFTDAVTSTMEPSMAVYDGGPYGYGQQPDYSSITEGIMHDAYPSNPYGPEALGAPQGFGNYGNAPIGYSPDAFSGAPMQTQAATPDVFSGQPMGAPQTFGNYGNQDVGYPSTGFNAQPNVATDMSLAGLSPVGQGVVGTGYNPAAVAAAAPIGAPAARGMSFADMTRGIVGYEDKPVTTTTQVANPAWSEWSKDFTKNNALQEAYLNDEMDRHGPAKPTNVPNYEWSPEPARTVSRTTTTTQRSPVYGDVPVGQPIGANLSQAGAGSWTSGLTNQANTIGAQINDFSNFGLEGFTGNFGTGIGDPSGGMSLGGLGGVGGGFSGALGGSYGPGGQPLGGSENQGGAGYGGSFSGSQGSDPSGRGGLY